MNVLLLDEDISTEVLNKILRTTRHLFCWEESAPGTIGRNITFLYRYDRFGDGVIIKYNDRK